MRYLSKSSATFGAIIALTALAGAAQAEVTGTIGAATKYLFRGVDLSQGSPHVYGSLDYAHESGFAAGVWASSEGPANRGGEYDLYASYGMNFGDFAMSIGAISYEYPTQGVDQNQDFFKTTEAVVTFEMLDTSLEVYQSLDTNGGSDYIYASLQQNFMDRVAAKIGYHDFEDGNRESMTHLDLTFMATDEVAFTLSHIVAQSNEIDRPAPATGLSGAFPESLSVIASWTKSFDID